MYRDVADMPREDMVFLSEWFDTEISRVLMSELYGCTIEEVSQRYGRLIGEYGPAQIRKIRQGQAVSIRLRRRRVARAVMDAFLDYCEEHTVDAAGVRQMVHAMLDAQRDVLLEAVEVRIA